MDFDEAIDNAYKQMEEWENGRNDSEKLSGY